MPRFSGAVKNNEDGTFTVTGNFAGAIYDEKGNITGYDPEKMEEGYHKVLIDRPMYDNAGNYREQQVVDVTKARIGHLDDQGRLQDSDLPLKTSAMYGDGYSEQEKDATDKTLAALDMKEKMEAIGSNVLNPKASAFGASTATPILEQTETEAQEEIPAKKYRARYIDEDVAAHSVAAPDIEVRRFMMGLSEFNMATEQEKTMLRQFKELNAALNVAEHAIREQTAKIRKLEAKKDKTAKERYDLQKAQNILKNYEKKREGLQAKMEKVTRDKGYAKLMMEQRKTLTDLVSGKTLADVQKTIASLTKEIDAVTKQMETRQQRIDEMEKDPLIRKAQEARTDEELDALKKRLENLRNKAKQAEGQAGAAQKGIENSIRYINALTEQSEAAMWKREKVRLVEQLKSENTQNLLKEQEKWKNRIARDKTARDQLEQNHKYVGQMNTTMKRMYQLLKAPKGTKNIPEFMQGLAREVLGLFLDNDMGEDTPKFLDMDKKGRAEMRRLLDAWEVQDGKFDLDQLKAAEEFVELAMATDLNIINDGIAALNGRIWGADYADGLRQRGEILEQIASAVSEIYDAIKAESTVMIRERQVAIEDAAYDVIQGIKGKKYREWTGTIGQKLGYLHKAIVSGNMTPEYFFRMLGNKGLSALWDNYHMAENRNGLELKKAKDRIAEIAEKYGYKNWDTKQKITLHLESGDTEITLGQLMSLWATWKRETTLGPAMSEHLTKGGFYAEPDLVDGLLGRQVLEKRAHVVTPEDMAAVGELLTEEQKQFIDEIVGYMSSEMSELGNEASMAAYGIKLYKESYYFPFKMWDGIRNRKSNDAGSAAGAQDRAFHPSFSKSRMHGANNAIMLGDFMTTAADHIAGMINYATMGLANESLQKVLNLKDEENGTKRNTMAILEEAYGMEAMQYLKELQVQLNGGAVRVEKTIYDRLISLFRKTR